MVCHSGVLGRMELLTFLDIAIVLALGKVKVEEQLLSTQ